MLEDEIWRQRGGVVCVRSGVPWVGQLKHVVFPALPWSRSPTTTSFYCMCVFPLSPCPCVYCTRSTVCARRRGRHEKDIHHEKHALDIQTREESRGRLGKGRAGNGHAKLVFLFWSLTDRPLVRSFPFLPSVSLENVTIYELLLGEEEVAPLLLSALLIIIPAHVHHR